MNATQIRALWIGVRKEMEPSNEAQYKNDHTENDVTLDLHIEFQKTIHCEDVFK